MHPLLIVLIVLGILVVLGVGGCVACAGIVGTTANKAAKEIDRSIKRQQNAHSITNAQARQLKLGTTKSEVLARFGAPDNTQELTSAGSHESCIYYNIRGGSYGRDWQFCFHGNGRRGKLTSKNRL
jgi:uncharacterized FAD-dependent dehydrogenase